MHSFRMFVITALLAGIPIINPSTNILLTANALAATPQAQLLGSHNFIADGNQMYTIHVALMDGNGQAVTGGSGNIRLSNGDKASLSEVGNGIYTASLTPSRIETPSDAIMNIRAKGPNRQSITDEVSIRLLPAPSKIVDLRSDPANLLLGADESATIKFAFENGFAEDAQLSIESSDGNVSNITYLGDNQYSALYTPNPKKLFPHISVITIVDQRDPEKTYAAYAFKQVGQTKFPIRTAPNATVTLEVGGRSFGPVQADSSGQARIPIRVPPGEGVAKQTTILGNDRTEDNIDLQIPSMNSLAFFPPPSSIPANDKLRIPIRLFVIDKKGNPDSTAAVNFSTTSGIISAAKHIGNGVYVANYQPPKGNSSSSATITADLSDTDQKLDLTVQLVPQIPNELELSFKQEKLAKNSVSFSVFSKLTDAENNGLSGSNFGFISYGARVNTTKDLGSGDYESTFTTSSDGSVEITAVPNVKAGSNPISNIVVIPSRGRINNDGLSSVALTMIALDQFGHPVADVPMELTLKSGDGQLPNSTKTDSYGVSQVSYTSGKSIGFTNIQITSGNISTHFQLPQVPTTSSLPDTPTFSGNDSQLALQKKWEQLIKTIRIDREGVEGSIISAKVEQLGEVSNILLDTEPSMGAPGGKITVQIRLADDSGNGIPNQSLEAIVSQGSLTAIQDLGGGRYSAQLTISDDSTEELKLSVSEANGKVSAFLKIPIVEGVSSSEEAEEEEEEEEIEEAGPTLGERIAEWKANRPSKDKSSGDIPKLRASLGYGGGFYGYQQNPSTIDGKLYGKRITFNNQTEGSASARTAGVDFRIRGFVPNFEYIGFEGKYHGDLYSVSLPEFNEPVPDLINEFDAVMIARYPFTSLDTQFHIGARLGFSADDFTIYTQQIVQTGEATLSYQALFVPSAIIGIEAAVESSIGLFADAYMDLALRGTIYRTQLGGNVGYSLPSNFYGYTGFRTSTREAPIEDADSGDKVGEILDSNTTLLIGAGLEF